MPAAREPTGGVPAPAERRTRLCQIILQHHEGGRTQSSKTEITITDVAGDPVELHLISGTDAIAIERTYDTAHRFMSERRRVRTEHGETRSTVTWERDERGRARGAERVVGPTAGDSAKAGNVIVAKVTAWHPNGRWLRRETRNTSGLARIEERTFDADGRVIVQEVTDGPSGEMPGAIVTTGFTYAGSARIPKTESETLVLPNGAKVPRRYTTYDARGRQSEVHIFTRGEEEGLWALTYDAEGRLASKTRADGVSDTYAYSGDCPIDAQALFATPNSAKD